MDLVKENDSLLRNNCEPWDFIIDGDPMPVVEQMTKIMFTNGGIGLAAPQVGINKRLFIMGNQDLLVACINPEIVETIGTVRDIEGCLSFPNLFLAVKRPEHIIVEFLDRDKQKHIIRLDNIDARCFLHELDHMDGKKFVELVGPATLMTAKRKQEKMMKKFVRRQKKK